MRHAQLILVAAIAIPLAGCVLSGKPKPVAAAPAPPQPAAPAPPPEPLSIPQTQVQLPAPQPLNPDALNTESHEEPAAQVQPKPTPPPPRAAHPTNAGPAKPADTPPVTDQQPAPEPARTLIHEVLPEDQRNRLRDDAHSHQDQTRKILAEVRPRKNQMRARNEIEQFLKQSQDAETAGDMRLADQLAERAHTLAKELQSGK
jgi:hypothetical protein